MERHIRVRLMKKKIVYVCLIIVLIGLTFIAYNQTIKNHSNSVVYIEAKNEVVLKNGFGFIYKIADNKNYILTNYHVVEETNDIYIYTAKNKKVKVFLLGYDEYTDIAILVLEGNFNLSTVTIGNSNEVEINDKIFVLGTPQKRENYNSKTKGIITKKTKEISVEMTSGTSILDAIEFSADIDYGNSGSPLINEKNEVIGMVFVKEKTKDIGYALPINYVMEIANKLEKNELNRPSLGAVMCNSTNTEMLNKYNIDIVDITGVVLLDLNESGVLYQFGLNKGDIVTKFNNESNLNVNILKKELYLKEKGNTVNIEYYRDGNYNTIEIKL